MGRKYYLRSVDDVTGFIKTLDTDDIDELMKALEARKAELAKAISPSILKE